MKSIFSKIDRGIYWVETLVSTIALIIITILVFLQVALRYTINVSPPWFEEVIISLIVVMAMYGAARGVRVHAHTEVSGVANALPKWAAILLRAITTLITLALLVATIYGTFFLASRTKSVTMMLRYPQKWTYWGMGSGAIFVLYEFLKVSKKRIMGEY